MNRVQATDEDLTIGTTVYRSKTAKKAWTVRAIDAPYEGRPIFVYVLTPGGAGFAARTLWIEV